GVSGVTRIAEALAYSMRAFTGGSKPITVPLATAPPDLDVMPRANWISTDSGTAPSSPLVWNCGSSSWSVETDSTASGVAKVDVALVDPATGRLAALRVRSSHFKRSVRSRARYPPIPKIAATVKKSIAFFQPDDAIVHFSTA